jgi:hypothetical protein
LDLKDLKDLAELVMFQDLKDHTGQADRADQKGQAELAMFQGLKDLADRKVILVQVVQVELIVQLEDQVVHVALVDHEEIKALRED